MVKSGLSRLIDGGAREVLCMRSLLLVHADKEELAGALSSAADAVVIDLPPTPDPALLEAVHDVLLSVADDETRPLLFLRIGGVDDEIDRMLAALMPASPDGIVLARCASGADVQQLGAKLAVLEAELDHADGGTAIIAEVGAVARSLLVLDSFVACSPRLLALAWNPQAFAAEAGTERETTGPCRTARHLVLIAARVADVGALAWADALDADPFTAAMQSARQEGFNAVLTDHPARVEAINAAFET